MKVPSSTQTRRVVLDAEDDDPLYQLGRSYFDSREYLRCFHLLQNATGSKSQFLASYALYLAGEMRKQESAAS
ncbi:hypothetical protein J0J20_24230, partial [Vibrio vulnificus]|nr:hypothetical protein [Vibrio vulnificus]